MIVIQIYIKYSMKMYYLTHINLIELKCKTITADTQWSKTLSG